MEETPSLVVRVTRSGRWEGKIGKWNFIGFYLIVWLRLFVGHPFQSLPKAQNPYRPLTKPKPNPKHPSPPKSQTHTPNKPIHTQPSPYLGKLIFITCLNQIKSLPKKQKSNQIPTKSNPIPNPN